MADNWTLNGMPFGAKVAATALIGAIGVGYLFALAQLQNRHGNLGVGKVARDYYGAPSLRDSLDAHWDAMRESLSARWDSGDRGSLTQESSATGGAFSLDDLAGFDDAETSGVGDGLLRRARSREHLEELVEQERNTDLIVNLGIPSNAQLVSLGHTHTFAQSAFFLPVAVLILLTSLPWTAKGLLAALPYIGIMLEFPSAMLTRNVSPAFAVLMLLAGGLMAAGYLACFVLALFELWVRPLVGGRRDETTAGV